MSTKRRVVLAVLVLVLGLGAGACGGDDDSSATEDTTTTETTTEETTTETTTDGESATAGRDVFVDNCGTCHTLSDAGTSGTVGPALDGLGLDAAAIESQVRNGGGGMPAFEGQLSDEDIQLVSVYVAESS